MKNILNDVWREYLSQVYDYIIRPMTTFHKGMIIAEDESGEILDSVNDILHFKIMKDNGKYHEITIDKSWPFDDDDLFREMLFDSAREANNGLLRINVTDIRLFDGFHCRIIKELAKQEELTCDIYVLLVIKGFSWEEIEDYAKRNHGSGQLNDMMRQWYRRIMKK